MSNYRRIYQNGGVYFFTLVTYQRRPILCEPHSITRIKAAFQYTQNKYPFTTEGLVILPDHLHCIWQLPQNDSDFSTRWNRFKRYFSIGIEGKVNHRREKHIWQHRFWEHLIQAENDLHQCLDYIHYNPVKHGYVDNPDDWPYSTFKRYLARGHYEPGWGVNNEPDSIKKMTME
jgi:putative transposase